MDYTLISHACFFAMLIFAFVYGCRKSFKKRGVAYMQIVTLAVGSMLLGELFKIVMFLCYGMFDSQFNIGMLGEAGCFFFTWSLAFGQIDGLGDDRSKAFRKYRMLALTQPLIFVGMLVAICFSGAEYAKIIIDTIMLLPMAMTSYFSLKHLIIPDVDCGIFDTMRKYNICLLVITLLSGASIVLSSFEMTFAVDMIRIIMGIDFAILVPIAAKGVEKWFS